MILNRIIFYFFSFFLVIILNYRSLLVDKQFGKYTDCVGCYKSWVMASDAKVLLVIFLVFIASFLIRNYIVRVLARVLVVVFSAYFLVDVYLFKSLNQRLYVSDIFTYFNSDLLLEIWNRNVVYTLLTLAIELVVVLFIFFHKKIKFNLFDKLVTLFMVFLFVGLIVSNKNINYVSDNLIKNIVEINFNSKQDVDYSQAMKVSADTQINDIEQLYCDTSGLNNKKNIILVLVESLSMYHSQLFSEINDWTPNLDKIALNNRYYSNFFANNFTSLEGRLAILTGEKTFRDIDKMGVDRGRVGYWNSQRNLAKLLKSKGYHTSFLDGANLDFSQTGEYMRGIGFDYVEGQEYEGYKDEQRYGFNSVSDDVLYNRVLEYIEGQQQPYFSTVITVTSHPPYIDPITKNSSIEASIKFADEALYDFYLELKTQHFFDNGLLIIMSDHRSMNPVSLAEQNKFGKQAVSRIPLIIVDNDYYGNAQNLAYLQQSDLLNSIDYYVSVKHCKRSDEGNILSVPAQAAECIYHSRGDYRDQIDVYCENGSQAATIQLNGDETQIIDGNLTNGVKVIDLINVSRIAAKNRHKVYINSNKND